ncbi:MULTISPECIES: IS66 family transposase, partial [Shigella]|uniref:IS66 family transposase n=1 Tax=Shigella TaxID=620 RepID=UPI0021123C9F
MVPTTYLVDTTLSNSSDSDQTVQAVRLQLMQSLYDWIQLQRKTLSKHAEMAKAFDYILNHWNALN